MKTSAVVISCLLFVSSVKSQDVYKAKEAQPASEPPSAKERFISNQDYLSKSSVATFQYHAQDSLKGFDEKSKKLELLANNVFGQEYINYMSILKREFINDKYHIGTRYQAQTSSSARSNKPTGGPVSINTAPCVNEDFELNAAGSYAGAANALAINGWTVSSGQNFCNGTTGEGMPTVWNAGSPEIWVRQTPILAIPFIGNIPNSPLGGSKIIQLQDQFANGLCTKIAQTFPVTANNTLFQLAYAGAYQDGSHNCCSQPFLKIRMFDCQGAPLSCSSLSLNPPGISCTSGSPGYTLTGSVYWSNWQIRYIDLTPYIGSCITIEIINSDCSPTGHWATTYFDAKCGGSLMCPTCNFPPSANTQTLSNGTISFCAGSNQAIIAAPLGYATYSWVAGPGAAPIAVNQTTASSITISNPVLNSVYYLYMTSQSGCPFVLTNTLTYSQINIQGIGTNSTCIGGASGSATVIGNGSGTGYTYSWVNSTNSVVGTSSVVTGLPPGVYTISIAGLGNAACGTASTTATISAGPNPPISVLKPFCNTEAYLSAPIGSGFQWFNSGGAISPTLGGIAQSYTVVNPANLSTISLTCTNQFGCNDSIVFNLFAATPGFFQVANVSPICPGGTNGTAIFNLSPSAGSPGGLNYYSVVSQVGTPAFSSSINPTSSNTYSVSNLQAGSYSVQAFDGSCKYNTTFNVTPYVYTWNVTPTSVTLCPGNSVASAITFPTPPSQTQFNYNWSSGSWLAGGATNYSSTIITPVVAAGTTSTQTLVITVTPTLVNCPTTKTITITGVNPPTPTITAIPNLCNTSQPYSILVSPAGGVFSTGITGTANPIGVNSGILNPNLASIGQNSLTYIYTQYVCSASSTATYQVSQFQTAALTSSVPPLCVTNAPFNLMNIVQSATGGTWVTTQAGPNGLQSSGPGAFTFNPAPGNTPLNTGNYFITYSTSSSPNPTVCPAFTQISVAVTKTSVPTVAPLQPFCTNAPNFNLQVNPTGGNWYGNSAVSSLGVVTPTTPGLFNQNSVNYSVSVGPCINYATAVFNVSQFNSAALTGTINPLCINNANFNLMSITQNTIGTWSGPGVTANAFVCATFSSDINISPATHVLSYFVPSFPTATLCPDTRTIAVSLYNPPTPNISNVGPYCNNAAPVQLTVSPAAGYWTSSSYMSGNGVFTPSASSVGNNAVQYVIGTSTCNASQTKFISIEAFVSAKISSKLPDQCNNGPIINLAPFTVSGVGNWVGQGINGSTFNPALSGSGSFNLIHKTASSPSGLCPDEDMIAVNVFSLATPVLTKLGPLCTNTKPVQIQVSPVGGLFSAANMGLVSLEGKFSPAAGLVGNNLVNYSITSGPCVAYAQMTVVVEKFVSAAFERSVSPICLVEGKTPAINLNGYVVNPGGYWEGDGIVLGSNMFDPSIAKIGKNNKVTYYTNSGLTPTLCPDQTEIMIEVRALPKTTAFSSLNTGCAPTEIEFSSPSYKDGEGKWNFDDGSEVKTGLTVTHVYTSPGIYNATYSYKDDAGCEAKPYKVEVIRIHTEPKADFTFPDEIYISNPEVQLTNLTTVLGDNTYLWTIKQPDKKTQQSNHVNPFVDFPTIGYYQITLEANGVAAAGGCTNAVTKMVEVKNDLKVFIPKAFTPNEDGKNDFFKPIFSEFGFETSYFEFLIYDRWGSIIFQTRDFKTKGWDGKLKGVTAQTGTYPFTIRYKDLDGNNYQKTGSVILLDN